MIGILPIKLDVDGVKYDIHTDFRSVLAVIQAFNDNALSDRAKAIICLKLYKTPPKNTKEALKKAIWFIDGGDMPKSKALPQKIMDWEQDEAIIFPAVNKVAGQETRTADYIHWWTFLGYFNEIGDGLFSQVMSIRTKRAKGKKLEKYEVEFLKSHKDLVEIRQKLTAEEQEELNFINNLV